MHKDDLGVLDTQNTQNDGVSLFDPTYTAKKKEMVLVESAINAAIFTVAYKICGSQKMQ